MSATLLVVTGQQRSGTSVFGDILGQTDAIHSFSEVFHHLSADLPHSFFWFVRYISPDPLASLYSGEQDKRALFENYIEYLNGLSQKRISLIDIKHNSLHHLNPCWHSLVDRPFICEILKSIGATIIHIVRRDVLSQVISLELATARGVFHTTDAGASSAIPILTPDPKRIVREIERSRAITIAIDQAFNSYSRYIKIVYEDMIEDDSLTSEIVDALERTLGWTLRPLPSARLRKISPPLEEFVTNIDEIRRQLVE